MIYHLYINIYLILRETHKILYGIAIDRKLETMYGEEKFHKIMCDEWTEKAKELETADGYESNMKRYSSFFSDGDQKDAQLPIENKVYTEWWYTSDDIKFEAVSEKNEHYNTKEGYTEHYHKRKWEPIKAFQMKTQDIEVDLSWMDMPEIKSKFPSVFPGDDKGPSSHHSHYSGKVVICFVKQKKIDKTRSKTKIDDEDILNQFCLNGMYIEYLYIFCILLINYLHIFLIIYQQKQILNHQ